jgi:SPP1 gp7 family putative phage head morphogenesis protein
MRKSVILRPIGPSSDFDSRLRVLTRSAVKALTVHIPALVAAASPDKLKSDSIGTVASRVLAALRETGREFLIGISEGLFGAYAIETARFDRRFRAQLTAHPVDGVNLSRVLASGTLGEDQLSAVTRHTALIKGLTDEVERRIAIRIHDMMIDGASTARIRDMLQSEFRASYRRANLIARDQASKWLGELNKKRQREAGVESYIWSTVLDERVRGNPDGRYPNAKPSHWVREGKTYRWDDAPPGGHPGYAINCRCTARAVLVFE